MSERLAHRSRPLRPGHRLLPARIVKAVFLPALRSMNIGFPIRSARKCRCGSVRVFDNQSRNHRRRIGGGHSVGIDDIVDGLNSNRVGPGTQLAGNLRAHELLPRHLLVRWKRVGRQHLRSVDPCRNSILPGRVEHRAPHGLPDRHRLPISDKLLGRLVRSQQRCVRAGNPDSRRVAHGIFLRRLVADPLGAPSLLRSQPRLPPADLALRIRHARRIPHLHPPERARRRCDGRPFVAHIQRFARIDPPAIPDVRLSLAQQLFTRGNQHLISSLLCASRRILQLP